MILSYNEIMKYIKNRKLVIEPFGEDIVRENGLDLRFGGEIARLKTANSVLDTRASNIEEYYLIERGEEFIINPHEKILFHTLEYIKMPNDLIGFINMRSSYARLGIVIPPTIIDAEFEGQLTIGLTGTSFPVKIRKGERIIHLILAKLTTPTIKPYKGRYKGQKGVQIPIFK